MSSWGHRIAPLTERERTIWTCEARGCQRPAAYECGYLYVTGRAGRVTDARRRRCAEHAATFARKHGLAMPATTSPS